MFRIIPHRAFVNPRVAAASAQEGRVTLEVEGLLCSACAARVRGAIEAVPGVERATVDLDSGVCRIETSGDVAPEALTRAVESTVVLRPLRRLLAAVGRPLAKGSH